MYNSRHPSQYPFQQRSKAFIHDDKSTFYGGQSYKQINGELINTRKNVFNPNLQNTTIYRSQANIPRQSYNQASSMYMVRQNPQNNRVQQMAQSFHPNQRPIQDQYLNHNQYIPQNFDQRQIPYQPIYVQNHPQYIRANYGQQRQVKQPQYIANVLNKQRISPPVPYEREFLNFRPVFPQELRKVPQKNLRYQSNQQQINDFKIYCPACHEQYYNSQVQEHIQKHYLYNTDKFKITNSLQTEADQYTQTLPLSIQTRTIYPLIQPEQFQTCQLDQVDYNNKYKVQSQDKNKKQSQIKIRSVGTQFTPPPLQTSSNKTDIYNCFDNIFNNRNDFRLQDITSSNGILAPKRELTEWQKVRSSKQGYQIKNKINKEVRY